MLTRTDVILRTVVVGCAATTIAITWPLWQFRTDPPPLPLVDLGPVPSGPLLLLALAVVLWRPALGAVAFAAALAVAMVADQTREQPQFVSMALLLGATVPRRGLREAGALHLAALWLWSGLGKLTSPRFLAQGGAWLVGGTAAANGPLATTSAISVGACEVALAVLALLPRTRRLAGWVGCAMHLAILALLIARGWNEAVWPWNAALAVAAPVLVGGTEGGLGAMLARGGAVARVALALFVLLPLGSRAGLVDAAFGHSLYTGSGTCALWLHGDGRTEVVGELRPLRVLLPPVPRMFEHWFARVGRPGDRLIVVDGGWLAALRGRRERVVESPSRSMP
jgi:hypothetical protein